MAGRGVPTYDDVRAVAVSVLRHRVMPNFQAEADGRSSADLIEELLEDSLTWM